MRYTVSNNAHFSIPDEATQQGFKYHVHLPPSAEPAEVVP